jgi:hypothetical protein
MGAERANSPPKLDPNRLQLGTQDSTIMTPPLQVLQRWSHLDIARFLFLVALKNTYGTSYHIN